MKQFNQLTREEMKNVLGGGPICAAKATCEDGTVVMGYLDCTDMDSGEDGDLACGPHGPSSSCDC